jgi:hypothetical protein
MSEATAKRPRREDTVRERIKLNVGGTVFETSRNTLAANATYFNRLLSTDWAENLASDEDEYFLDRDPEAFRLLLQYMRHNNLLAVMPQEQPRLCMAVLLEAEYLGVEKLLQSAKALVRKQLGSTEVVDAAAEVAAFDAEHGGLVGAMSSGVLPRGLFGPPPKKKVLQLMPAREHDRIDWMSGSPRNGVENVRLEASRRMMGLALVELPDGTRDIDAIFANPHGNVDAKKGPFYLAKADGAGLRRRIDDLRCRLRDTQETREVYQVRNCKADDLQETLDSATQHGWSLKHIQNDPSLGDYMMGVMSRREEC